MKKYIINGKTYECKTEQPHGYLRDLLINAQLREEEEKKKREEYVWNVLNNYRK